MYRLNIFPKLFRFGFLKDHTSVPLGGWVFNRKLKRFFDHFKVEEYDLLHIIDARSCFFVRKGLQDRTKIITSLNSYYELATSWNPLKFFYNSTDLVQRYVYYNLVKYYMKKYLPYSEVVIANSRYTADVLRATAPGPKAEIVYRGIYIKKFSIKPAKGKYSSHEVLFVGKNMERKGGIYLLMAVPEILKKFPDAHFTLIGMGNEKYMKKMHAFIAKHGIEKSVTLIDHVPPKDIPQYFAKANVFCMPSHIEALGQVQLEAMAAWTPVVVTDTGGIPETVENGGGLLVPPKDIPAIAGAICKIFSDPAEAKKMGLSGRKNVLARFSYEGMSKDTLKIYEQLLSHK